MKLEDITTAAVIGSGTMGAGIGLCLALAGIETRLFDIAPSQLDLAEKRAAYSAGLMVQEGLITGEQAQAAQAKMSYTLDFEAAARGGQFVLEAAPEKLEVKHQTFARLEEVCGPEAVLVTNTSGLPITSVTEKMAHPERTVGMHWFNPPEFVPLVEVIRGAKSGQAAMDLTYALVEKMGKEPIIVNKDVPGFAGNRLQLAAYREALNLVAEGVVSPEDVDKAMKSGPGFRWSWQGPLETSDLGGLDIFGLVAEYLFKDLSNMTELPEFFKAMVDKGDLGLKTGHGFYDYDAQSGPGIVAKRDSYFVRQLALQKKIRES